MSNILGIKAWSGDQGVDLIVTKNNIKIGVQTKCYSGTVGNKAIQEIVAGVIHHQLHQGIVITNNFFTPSAIELAKTNDIILWDRNILKEKINESYINSPVN
jgi:HJR/Mrr/RecB family endonuclease